MGSSDTRIKDFDYSYMKDMLAELERGKIDESTKKIIETVKGLLKKKEDDSKNNPDLN